MLTPERRAELRKVYSGDTICQVSEKFITELLDEIDALTKERDAAEKVLDDIACEKQNLHGRIDDSNLAHEICDMASEYFTKQEPKP